MENNSYWEWEQIDNNITENLIQRQTILLLALSSGATKGSSQRLQMFKAGQLAGSKRQKQVDHTSISPKPQRVKLPYVATKYVCENFKSMQVSHLAPAPTGYLGMKRKTGKVNSVLLDVLIFS